MPPEPESKNELQRELNLSPRVCMEETTEERIGNYGSPKCRLALGLPDLAERLPGVYPIEAVNELGAKLQLLALRLIGILPEAQNRSPPNPVHRRCCAHVGFVEGWPLEKHRKSSLRWYPHTGRANKRYGGSSASLFTRRRETTLPARVRTRNSMLAFLRTPSPVARGESSAAESGPPHATRLSNN